MAIDRINAVKRIVRDKKLDAILFTDLLNVRYLSGYSGSSGMLLVTPHSADFFTDFRYKEQSAREVRGAKITIIENSLLEDLSKNAVYIKAKTVGIEEQNMTYAQLLNLQKISPKKRFVAVGMVAENLRQVKSAEEIGKIANAAKIADQAFERIVRFIKPGMAESAIAAQLDHTLKMLGASNPSFDSIIGSGPNGALPHAKPGSRKVRKGDFIVLDFGAIWQGYHSDMTRTVCLGRPTEKHLKIYDIVTKAQLTGLKAVKAGIRGCEADKAARKIIDDAGYGKYYGHGLGHGVGLAVHEKPGVGAKSENILMENSIVTVEPGIYLPGWGGVRIEDLVVVKKGACRILSGSTKRLITIKA
jgi:Xaa-Pro aminopeptidase